MNILIDIATVLLTVLVLAYYATATMTSNWTHVSTALPSTCSLDSSRCTYTKVQNCTMNLWPSHCMNTARGLSRGITMYHFDVRNVRVLDVLSWFDWLRAYNAARGNVEHTFIAVNVQQLLDQLDTPLPVRALQEMRLDAMQLPETWFSGVALRNLASVARLQLTSLGLLRPPPVNVSGLRELDLSGNKIALVTRDLFVDMRVDSLYALVLRRNRICYVEVGAFAAVPSLQSLDLAENQLNVLGSNFYLLNRFDYDVPDGIPCVFRQDGEFWLQDCCPQTRTHAPSETSTTTVSTKSSTKCVTKPRRTTPPATTSRQRQLEVSSAAELQMDQSAERDDVSAIAVNAAEAKFSTSNIVIIGIISSFVLLLTGALGVLLYRCRRDSDRRRRRGANVRNGGTANHEVLENAQLDAIASPYESGAHRTKHALVRNNDTRSDAESEQLLRLVIVDVQPPNMRLTSAQV